MKCKAKHAVVIILLHAFLIQSAPHPRAWDRSLQAPRFARTTYGLDQNYGITYVDALTQADCGTTPNCTYCNPALKCQYVLNYCACTYTGSSPACTTITNIASAAAGATIYYGPCEISPINVTQVNTQGNGCTMRYSGCYDFYPNPPCSNSVPANSECCTALGPKNGSGCNLTCNGTDVLGLQ